LEVAEQLVIGRDQLATLALGQGHIHAIVETASGLRRDLYGPIVPGVHLDTPDVLLKWLRITNALSRAASGQSLSNWPAIFAGFTAKGIPENEIKPRENVFTYHAWRALGRRVSRRIAVPL
jgi:hypothetical protein